MTAPVVGRHSLHDAAFGRIAVVRLGGDGRKHKFGLTIRWPGGSAHACGRVPAPEGAADISADSFAAVAQEILRLIDEMSPSDMGITLLVSWPNIVENVMLAEAGSDGARPEFAKLVTSRRWQRMKPFLRMAYAIHGGLDDETILGECAGLMLRSASRGKTIAVKSEEPGWRLYLYASAYSAATGRGIPYIPRKTAAVRLAGRMIESEFKASDLPGSAKVSLVHALKALDALERRTARLACIEKDGKLRHVGMASDGRSIDVVSRARPGSKDAPSMSLFSMRTNASLPAFLVTWNLAADDTLEPSSLRGHLARTGEQIAKLSLKTVEIHADFSQRDGKRTYGFVAVTGRIGIFGRLVDKARRQISSSKVEEAEARACHMAFQAALKAFPDARRFVIHCDNMATVRHFHMSFFQRADAEALSPACVRMIDLACQRGVLIDMHWQKGHSASLTDGTFLNQVAHSLAFSERWAVHPDRPGADWAGKAAEFIGDDDPAFPASQVAAFLGLPDHTVRALVDSGWLKDRANGNIPLSSIMRIMAPLRREMRGEDGDGDAKQPEEGQSGASGRCDDLVASDRFGL